MGQETRKEIYIEIYINETLKEIKGFVKNKINLKKEQEIITDEKMSSILKDLINANFKNIQTDEYGNLIYTLLPLTDKKENNKIRCTLVLLYTSLYFENITLLNNFIKAEINFGEYPHDLYLCLLDKDISSKLDEDKYILIAKNHKSMINHFYSSIKNLEKKEREKYITRFTTILKTRHETFTKKMDPYLDFYLLFTKKVMDIFEDKTYLLASEEQLHNMDKVCSIKQKDTINRLNTLIQTTDFNQHYSNYDLMFQLFEDKELFNKDYWISSYFDRFSDSEKMLNKAMDLYNRCPDFADFSYDRCTKVLRDIDNDTLIKLKDKIDFHQNIEYLELMVKNPKQKRLIRKLLKK